MTRSKSSAVALRLPKQRHLLAMEVRILEGDRLLDDADEHVAAAMGDEVEALLHRPRLAGRVEDDVEAVAVGEARRPRLRRRRRGATVDAGDRLRARRARSGVAVEHGDLAARQGRRRAPTPRPIGPAPTTSTRSPPAIRAAPHRMGADGEKLDRRALIGAQARRRGRGSLPAATAARPCRRPGGRRAPRCSRSNSACPPGRRCSRRRRDRD